MVRGVPAVVDAGARLGGPDVAPARPDRTGEVRECVPDGVPDGLSPPDVLHPAAASTTAAVSHQMLTSLDALPTLRISLTRQPDLSRKAVALVDSPLSVSVLGTGVLGIRIWGSSAGLTLPQITCGRDHLDQSALEFLAFLDFLDHPGGGRLTGGSLGSRGWSQHLIELGC